MPIINGRGRVGIRKAGAAAPSIVLDGLKLYLDAGNAASYAGTGTTWTDLSGNGHNGTLTNGPTYNSANGGSIVFDGTNDYANFGDVLDFGLNDFTVNVWLKINSNWGAVDVNPGFGVMNTNRYFAGKGIIGAQNFRWAFGFTQARCLRVYFVGIDPQSIAFNTTASLNLNQWYMCTLVANRASDAKIYINGVQQSLDASSNISIFSSLNFQNNSPFRIGSATLYDNVSSVTEFPGNISVVQKYFRALTAAEVLQNYNAMLGRFYPVVSDADAQAFVVAAGLTSSVQANAVNALVTSLKAAGIWSKMKAIYPFVGGSAAAHKWNLKDPRDLNAAYRLTFTSGMVHGSNGVLPNGTSDFANTFFNPMAAGVTKTNFGMTVYSRTNNVRDGVDIGAVNSSNSSYVQLRIRYNSTTDFVGIYDNSFFYGNYVTNSSGLFTSVRESSTVQTFYQNGVQKAQRTGFSTTGDINLNIYLSARNLDGAATTFSNRQLAFGAIHDSLSGAEALSFYNAVQAYQTALGRQV